MQTQSVLNLVSWETQQSAATAIKELETSRLSTFLFPPTHPHILQLVVVQKQHYE